MRRTSPHRPARALPVVVLLLAAAGLPAASMWQSETMADGTLYSDQVARKKGDLITILVKETTSVVDNNKTETKRKSDPISASVTMVPGSDQVAASSGASTIGKLPAFSATSENNFKGEGTVTQTGEVKATITGRVIDVLDNGNLLVEGRRQVKVNDDTKTILVTGIVRTADLKSDNTIQSEKLHNFQIAIENEGPIARSQKKGFLGEMIDVIWPF